MVQQKGNRRCRANPGFCSSVLRAGRTRQEGPSLYKVVTTHTARHTGADMLMLGSGGDFNLK
jgi:hypothetical protein